MTKLKRIGLIAVLFSATAIMWFAEWQPAARQCKRAGGSFFAGSGECLKMEWKTVPPASSVVE